MSAFLRNSPKKYVTRASMASGIAQNPISASEADRQRRIQEARIQNGIIDRRWYMQLPKFERDSDDPMP